MVEYLQRQRDTVAALRLVFVLGLWDYIPITYSKCRNYEGGLALAEYLDWVMVTNTHRIAAQEYEEWDSRVVFLKLDMLDGLNRWLDYIEYYEEMRQSKRYCTPLKSFDEPVGDYKGYIVGANENFELIHFLYQYRRPYEAIKQKYAKWRAGGKVGNLRRHSQSELTEADIQDRLAFITMQLDHELARLNYYGVAHIRPELEQHQDAIDSGRLLNE